MLTEKQKRILDIYRTVIVSGTITTEEEDRLLISAETLALLAETRTKTKRHKRDNVVRKENEGGEENKSMHSKRRSCS